jgi:hypothetical protein
MTVPFLGHRLGQLSPESRRGDSGQMAIESEILAVWALAPGGIALSVFLRRHTDRAEEVIAQRIVGAKP